MAQTFLFSHRTHHETDQRVQRFFEIIPGFLSWSILGTLTVLSFTYPLYAACAIIAFDIYWLLRLFYMTIFLVLAFAVLEVENKTNWIQRCRLLEKGPKGLPAIRKPLKIAWGRRRFKSWLSLKNQERELSKVIASGITIPQFAFIYHVVLIAAAKEGAEVLEPTLDALRNSQFPTVRMIPVLAIEARTGTKHEEMAQELRKKYQDDFFDFLVSVHPDGIPGEARVKGANVTYAAKQVAELLEKRKINFENVILSCFDADTVASPEYFACLTYHFMRHPHRTRASYQPIPVYYNNIWEASGFARVLEMGSSFFQLIEATNPEKLVTFSSHSMSFKALVEIGYWPVDMISDDSAIFWKALIHYGGDYRVVPMYVTLSMDVVMAGSIWQTLMMIYKQKRRWAWGVENFPIVMRAFVQDKQIPLYKKLSYTFKLIEMHVSWATAGFVLTVIGWLPGMVAGREFSSSVLYYNSARITELIFNLASTALVVSIILALLLLPRHKHRDSLKNRILIALEWLTVPLVFTFLSTMPALDAQTRLARGANMTFWITEKVRKKK